MPGDWRSSAAYRIAGANALAFAIGTALLGVIVYGAMHVAFTRQIDGMIEDEARALVGEYHSDEPDELARAIAQREASRERERLLYAVFAPDGRRVLGSLQTKRPPLGFHDLTFVDPSEGRDRGRGLAIDLSPDQRLLVAADRERIERIDRTILTVFGFGFLGVCALGLIGALVLGAYLRARLRALSDGATAIVGGDIRARMPVGGRRDEFDQLAVALNLMLERIEGLLDNLRNVTSGVAHELRPPLSRLRNQLETGGSEIDPSNTAAVGVIEDAIHGVDEVLALFAAILRIAEIEAGETSRRFAPIDMSRLATELAESYAPAVRDAGRNLIWAIDPDITVNGDRELDAQAGANFLENAQIHTPPATLIRLTLVAAGPFACLRVSDNGPGVAKADRGRIVERFRRLDVSRDKPGHGLGLNLVNAVARLHGGRLVFDDCALGLSATLELPLMPSSTGVDHDRSTRSGT